MGAVIQTGVQPVVHHLQEPDLTFGTSQEPPVGEAPVIHAPIHMDALVRAHVQVVAHQSRRVHAPDAAPLVTIHGDGRIEGDMGVPFVEPHPHIAPLISHHGQDRVVHEPGFRVHLFHKRSVRGKDVQTPQDGAEHDAVADPDALVDLHAGEFIGGCRRPAAECGTVVAVHAPCRCSDEPFPIAERQDGLHFRVGQKPAPGDRIHAPALEFMQPATDHLGHEPPIGGMQEHHRPGNLHLRDPLQVVPQNASEALEIHRPVERMDGPELLVGQRCAGMQGHQRGIGQGTTFVGHPISELLERTGIHPVADGGHRSHDGSLRQAMQPGRLAIHHHQSEIVGQE